MIKIIRFVTGEGWEFEFHGGDITSFEVGIFDGRLILRSDGTWAYEEA